MYTYRIVVNVSTRFYFSVYATISLASCCLCRGQLPSILPSNAIYLGYRELQQYQLYNPPFLVLERNQLLLRFVSTCDNHATVNHVYTTFCGTFLYSSVYTSTCRFAERAVLHFFRDRFTLCVHHYTEPVAH